MTSRTRFAGISVIASIALLLGAAISCSPDHAQMPPKPVAAMNVPVTPPVVPEATTKPTAGVTTRRAVPFRSPELGPDRRVTFRLRAPRSATTAVVEMQHLTTAPVLPMTRASDGVWSVTSAPLEPDLY